jgi:hypothetical protein
LTLLLVFLLAAAPIGLAHTDQGGPGTPDTSCQSPSEWQVHDYAPPAQFDALLGIRDGNLEECGTTYGFSRGAQECREMEDRFGFGPGNLLWEMSCNTDEPADYDGDFEFALGGALLAVDNGDGQTFGSLVCYGTLGHHGSVITVVDKVLNPVAFSVGADASLVPPPPGEPDCGDGTISPCGSSPGPTCNPNDHLLSCPIQRNGTCTVDFGPGADGAYYVFVGRAARPGLGGHVFTT